MGSMMDAADTDEPAFEKLQQDEQDLCVLAVSLLCAVVLLLVSLL